MPSTPYRSGFELTEATEEDLDDMVDVQLKAFAGDEFWELLVRDVEPEPLRQWTKEFARVRFSIPNLKRFAIRER